MAKFLTVLICTVALFSCKTITLKRESFFDAPVNKIRLFESPDLAENNLSYKTTRIQVADSVKIEIRTISTKNPENCFFFFTPSSNTIAIFEEMMEKVALQTNSKVIGIQYRGFNYSDGTPHFDTCFKDNEIIFSTFKNEIHKYKTVNFVGLSIGTIFAPKLAAAHKDEISNLILMSTFSTPQSMLTGIKSSIPSIVRPFIKLKADKNLYFLNNVITLENFQNGLLIVQAKDDAETNYKMAVELYETSHTTKKELMTLESGGHFAPFSKKYIDSIVSKISGFIKK